MDQLFHPPHLYSHLLRLLCIALTNWLHLTQCHELKLSRSMSSGSSCSIGPTWNVAQAFAHEVIKLFATNESHSVKTSSLLAKSHSSPELAAKVLLLTSGLGSRMDDDLQHDTGDTSIMPSSTCSSDERYSGLYDIIRTRRMSMS